MANTTHAIDREQIAQAVKALSELTVTAPELADPVCSECGWDQANHDLMETGPYPCVKFVGQPPEDTPFFSEAFLYWLLGKHEARAVRSSVNRLIRAAGGEPI